MSLMSPREWEIVDIQSFWLASLSDEILNTRPGTWHNTVHIDIPYRRNFHWWKFHGVSMILIYRSYSKEFQGSAWHTQISHGQNNSILCNTERYTHSSNLSDDATSQLASNIHVHAHTHMHIIYTFMSNPKPFFPLLLSMPVHSNRSTDPRELSFCNVGKYKEMPIYRPPLSKAHQDDVANNCLQWSSQWL